MKKTITINIPEGYDDAVFNKETNEIKFVKKDTKPRSWDEYRKQVRNIFCFSIDIAGTEGCIVKRNRRGNPFVNEFNTEEEAKAVVALCKLIQLRDAWWGDWKPDWSDNNVPKYGICNELYCYNKILVFPTAEMRDEFLNTFRDLIEEAKSLL